MQSLSGGDEAGMGRRVFRKGLGRGHVNTDLKDMEGSRPRNGEEEGGLGRRVRGG